MRSLIIIVVVVAITYYITKYKPQALAQIGL